MFDQIEEAADWEFFVTEKGYMGLTNGHVKPGDLIILVPALAGPAIIRIHQEKRGYKFVGVADIADMIPRWSKCWPYGVQDCDKDTIWDDDKLAIHPLTVFELI